MANKSVTEPAMPLSMNSAEQTNFIRYINSLPEKPTCTVRFFNHGDFYSLVQDDAHVASDFVRKIVKYMGDKPKLDYIAIKRQEFEKLIYDLLLIRQYRVEVYIKSQTKWQLEYKGSPGNLSQFEEILFNNDSTTASTTNTLNNYVMAIKVLKNYRMAVACINTTELKMEVCELNDSECFIELEALIAQISPRECIIQLGASPDLKSLKKVLERNGVLVTQMKSTDFNSKHLHQDLNRLLFFVTDTPRNCEIYPEVQDRIECMDSLQVVVNFLGLTGDEQNFDQFKLSSLNYNRFVRLDNAALYSLNILPKLEQNTIVSNNSKSMNSTSSVLGILDSCVTMQGRRLLEHWIKQPLKDYNLINERLDVVECFVKNAEVRQLLASDCLTKLTDLLFLSKKLTTKKAKLLDCYRIYQVVANVPRLVEILQDTRNTCIKSMLVDAINEILCDLQRFQAMIEKVLDFDLIDQGVYFIKPDLDENLKELYDSREKIQEQFQQLLRSASRDLGFDNKTMKLECNDQYGYYFRVTLKEEPALRSNSNYKIIDAVKGGVRFTNNKLKNLNEEYLDVKNAYEEQQKNLIVKVFEVAAGYSETLRSLNIYIATVDVLVSFANVAVAARIPYIRPKLLKDGPRTLKLEQVRHPCVEQQDHLSYIPNSVEFSETDKTLYIITGPNMCGKSTYIRSIGVCMLMAQVGSFVPCSYAEMSLVDAIFSRVGADDSPISGLSTFMLEMIEASTIIKGATSNSLVIIDELGRGTSTYDGCGIAWAIAEHLAKEIKCFSLFATHFHEIMRLPALYPSVKNLHVTAVTTNNTITPLYQVREGESDKSYGIHCARLAEFPEDVIQNATRHQKYLEHSGGMQFIDNYDSSLKRKIIEQGDSIVRDVLDQFKSMDVEHLTDEEIDAKRAKLKPRLEESDNLFVKGLLSA